jgi:hypothetical protein
VSGGVVEFCQLFQRTDVFRRRKVGRAFVAMPVIAQSPVGQMPTGCASILSGWTGGRPGRRALIDLPTRYQRQQSAQPFLVQPFLVYEVTNTTHPCQVMVGVEPAIVSPCGPEQPAFFVQAKGAWMDVQELGSNTYRIEGSRSIGHLGLPLFHSPLRLYCLTCPHSFVKL